MKYHFSRYKFSSKIFYDKIDRATVKVYSDCFTIEVLPYFHYSGNFFKHSIYYQDKEKTVYRTLRVEPNVVEVNLEHLSSFNEYFIGIYKNGRKLTISQSNLDGIILKT